MPLQIRRGTEAERQSLASPLVSGELLWITDDKRLFIGDGTTLAKDLNAVTGYNSEDAQDDAAGLFTSGTHTNITFVYNDSTNSIDASVDLSTYAGEINALAFKGSVLANDSTQLVNAEDGSLNLDGTVKGNIVPDITEAYDIGSISTRFRNIYLEDGSAIFLGSAALRSNSDGTLDLPLGSTIGGIDVAGISSEGVLNVTIIADDSTTMVNTATKRFNGILDGDVNGNVIGDLIGSVDGTFQGTASGAFFGDLEGDVVGSVFREDSTVAIDGTSRNIFGNLTGDVVGNVTGNLVGDVVGNVIGDVVGDLKGSVVDDGSNVIIDGTSGLVRGNLNNIEIATTRITVQGVTNTSRLDQVGLQLQIDDISDNSYGSSGFSITSSQGPDSEADLFRILTFHNDSAASDALYFRAKGSVSSPSSLSAGDGIYTFRFVGQGANDASQVATMEILADPNGTIGSDIVPGKIEFKTNNNSGVLSTKLSIDKDGIIDFFDNTTTAGSNPGEVDLATSTVAESWLRVKVGGVEYALPLYAINP